MSKWMSVLACVWGVTVAQGAEMITTNFKADFLPIKQIEQNLRDNGLIVLGTHEVMENTNYTSIVYTSADLKTLGQEAGRGFVSVMRILHNADAKELVVSNPEYFIRAFFQDDYQDGMEAPVLKALEAALGTLTPTEDGLSAKKLAKYHFKVMMPYYDDFERVAKGDTASLILDLEANASDQVVFKLELNEDGSSVLYGIALPVKVETFNEKIGTMDRSHLLPYTVLIENGEANILRPKFYLAVSFPRLTMVEFGKIMMTPGKIKNAFEDCFE